MHKRGNTKSIKPSKPDKCRYVKINFSLLNDVSQDAIEINRYITQRNAKCSAME